MTTKTTRGQVKWVMEFSFKLLPQRREIKPTGKLVLHGSELTVEQTSNYFKALK